ncbi:hypothetical protein K501DRAFT_230499 [Backusella circina FSU 941]|nr:hypothetical protein K501DRAFT_230499 [Backusella circina FSU 941]
MKSLHRYSEKQPVTNDLYHESYDDDCLVDYDASDIEKKKKVKLIPSALGQQVKRKLSNKKRQQPDHPDYIIEYTRHGEIKRPAYSLAGGYHDNVAISMEMIRSVVLVQHCQLEQHDKVEWFMDGIRWLAHKQVSSNKFSSHSIQDVEGLERSCEAYFGIPLGLCEDHWAADYLIRQCKRESSFHRKLFKPNKSGRSVGTFLRKLCCFFPLSMPKKKKRYTSDYGAVDYNEKGYPLSL